MNQFKRLDFFTRQPEQDILFWMAVGLSGSLILPSSIPWEDEKVTVEKMNVLSRENAVMVCNPEDLKYVRNRSRTRPVLLLEGEHVRVLLADGVVDAILPKTVEGVRDYFAKRNPPPRRVEKIGNKSIGIVYMCFGWKAAREIGKSLESLRGIGLEMPVCVVGDPLPSPPLPLRGTSNAAHLWEGVQWKGESPFDGEQAKNFQFRAGRVKPYLYDYSPFDYTLYIDADTEFMADITPGFELLDEHDMAVTEETLSLGQLYNKKLAGWEINLVERDATIEELGGDAKLKFINSGVIFFKKSKAAQETFAEWGRQWLRFQQWDEQLALMRAMNAVKGKYKALSVDWNNPHREQAKVIFHNYGRGVARVNLQKEESNGR